MSERRCACGHGQRPCACPNLGQAGTVAAPFLLSPYYKSCIWGGDSLARLYGKRADIPQLGETWECSVHPAGQSTVASGCFTGRLLDDVLSEYPSLLGEENELPILIKLIDAQSDLSVQVHPDDAYAVSHEGQRGKTEMWYILEALPGAQLVLGFDRPLTRQQAHEAAEHGELGRYLRHVPVKRGDAFLIEPGTVHAIGAGIVLAEIQQSSDVTYRLWDYGRKDKDGKMRPLHIDSALDVAVLDGRAIEPLYRHPAGSGITEICKTKYFNVSRIESKTAAIADGTDGSGTLLPTERNAASVLLCIDGSGELRSERGVDRHAESYPSFDAPDGISVAAAIGVNDVYQAPHSALTFKRGDCIFVPAGNTRLSLTGDCTCLHVTF